jgi:hypothetical protein
LNILRASGRADRAAWNDAADFAPTAPFVIVAKRVLATALKMRWGDACRVPGQCWSLPSLCNKETKKIK